MSQLHIEIRKGLGRTHRTVLYFGNAPVFTFYEHSDVEVLLSDCQITSAFGRTMKVRYTSDQWVEVTYWDGDKAKYNHHHYPCRDWMAAVALRKL